MRLLFFFLILVSIHLSKALFSQVNSSVLRLPSRNTTLTAGGTRTVISLKRSPWPFLPFRRYIKDGLSLEVTAFGDSFSDIHISNILLTLLELERTVLHAGRPDEVLEDIVTVGETSGRVYANIGFYSLHPPVGITLSQAGDVLQMAWQLMAEHEPPREITSSTVLYGEKDVTLFRLSFRIS